MAHLGVFALTQPSIKGSAITGTVEDVKKLVQKGAISEKELEQRLTGGALALVGQPIVVSGWYDMRAVASLVELLWDVEGHGDPAYLRRRGEETAERLLQAGLYTQLEFVKHHKLDGRSDAKARFEAFGRDLRRIVTLSGSIYNFGRWSVRPDPEREGRYLIEIHEATALPVPTSLATEGFLNRIAKEHGTHLWRMERPRPDLVVYIMDRPLGVFTPSDPPANARVVPSAGRERSDAASFPKSSKHAVKGSVFVGIVQAVLRLRDAKRIEEIELERRLGDDGLAYLSSETALSGWYPIQVYARMRELLRDIEGDGDDAYTENSAAESARRLIDSGLYQQLNSLERWSQYQRSGDEQRDAEERRQRFRQQLNLVSTLYNALYNFGTQKVTVDPEHPDRFQLEYWDEGVMPRSCRFAVLGFWNELGLRWSSKRQLFRLEHSSDHYMLRMTRDVADV
jgi:hypothetical protein